MFSAVLSQWQWCVTRLQSLVREDSWWPQTSSAPQWLYHIKTLQQKSLLSVVTVRDVWSCYYPPMNSSRAQPLLELKPIIKSWTAVGLLSLHIHNTENTGAAASLPTSHTPGLCCKFVPYEIQKSNEWRADLLFNTSFLFSRQFFWVECSYKALLSQQGERWQQANF